MILFLPIDIDLNDFNFVQFDKSKQLKSLNPYWDSTAISNDTITKNNFDRILNQLPFRQITRLSYKIQEKIVESHLDVHDLMTFEDNEFDHIKANEPAGYRLVIKGADDRLEIFNGKSWVTAYTPQTPCCYVINSTSARHRVKEDTGRQIIYVRGFLDIERHQALLQKSYNKYKKYAINAYEPN
jgi:hypothetical protein